MKSAFLLLAPALIGCSTLQDDRAPACHGQRRPANPHGSILAAEPPAAAPPAMPPPPGGGCGARP